MPRLPIVVALLGILGGSGAADGIRYAHTPRIPPRSTLSERVRPTPQGTSVSAKPTVDVDSILSIEDLTKPIRAEQEQILIQLIANTADSEVEEKSDYYFRLGSLYAQQHRFWRIKSAEAKTPKDVALAANHAKEYLLKTVKTFKGLAENDAFRNYPKMDSALFYYGYTLQSGKYLKEARAVYDKLLKNYPNSKYVPEAHLAFAEYYFDANQLADAEARYKMVLKFPKSTGYWYAMYKVGWIHLDLQRFQEALETFFQVSQATKNDVKLVALNHAAKLDFVRAYAEIGKPDKARAAFQRVDAKAADEMVAFLTELYAAQGKAEKSIYSYRELIANQPTSPQVCAWQYAVAHGMLAMPGATNADKVKEIESLVKLWTAVQTRLPPAEAQACRGDAAAMSGELARAFHIEATQTKTVETFGYAERLYAAYVDGFPDAADRAQMQLFRAEALWAIAEGEPNARLRTERWERAAGAFGAVGPTDSASQGAAALASVVAWKLALDLDPDLTVLAGKIDIPAASRANVPSPQLVPPREVKMLAAFDAAAPNILDPEELTHMKLIAAIIHRRARRIDNAIPLLEGIVSRHRQSDSIELAANLLLESLLLVQHYDDVRELADSLHADTGLLANKPELTKNVDFVRTHALRR